ncbi:MAG TPA: hypothetical protein VE178_07625 [Silvibacterium sp.]|nr:hypothetical protein [Silvibacterium sp.]
MPDNAIPDHAIKDRDDLDLLLDAALATYVDVEAEPGLTHRVLAAARHLQPRRSSLRWLPLAISALAAALLVSIYLVRRAGAPSNPAPLVAKVPATTFSTSLKSNSLSPAHRAREHAARAVSRPAEPQLPRLEVFPTPTALSSEERALLTAAHGNPERVPGQLTQSATGLDRQSVEPLHIATIEIPPLNPPRNGGN